MKPDSRTVAKIPHAVGTQLERSTPATRVCGCDHDCDRFFQESLVPQLVVKINRGHEALLRRVRMDPADSHETLPQLVHQQVLLALSSARVGRCVLLWNDQMGYAQLASFAVLTVIEYFAC